MFIRRAALIALLSGGVYQGVCASDAGTFAHYIGGEESVSTLSLREDVSSYSDEAIVDFLQSDADLRLKVKAAHYGLDRDHGEITEFYEMHVLSKIETLVQDPPTGGFDLCRDLVSWDIDDFSRGCVQGFIAYKISHSNPDGVSLSSLVWRTLSR